MASLTTLSHHTLPTENLLEDAAGLLRLLPSASADARSPDDVIAF